MSTDPGEANAVVTYATVTATVTYEATDAAGKTGTARTSSGAGTF
ncbi:hypothetical protein [Roseicyclus salinarum]|nr:hypothetical protein [Roseibacterium sp. SDUM158017]